MTNTQIAEKILEIAIALNDYSWISSIGKQIHLSEEEEQLLFGCYPIRAQQLEEWFTIKRKKKENILGSLLRITDRLFLLIQPSVTDVYEIVIQLKKEYEEIKKELQ